VFLPEFVEPQLSLVVWDTHTGVFIKEFEICGSEAVIFHGDQRKITSVTRWLDFYTYDVLNGTQLCQGQLSPWKTSKLGSHWVHNDTLQFATTCKTDGESVINIHELQPASTPPLHLLSSFPIPPQFQDFSFSQVSFHASFVTSTEVTILNTQSSNVLLQTKLAQGAPEQGQFSNDGCFIAYRSQDEIHVWQNTSTGYVPWSNLRPRLSHHAFLWSPTSISIRCFGGMGIQLFHPDNYLMSPNKVESNLDRYHLVAYSVDQRYIAITQRESSVIVVIDHLFGTTQQPISTGMQIQDIKIINNTIFVVDKHRFSSWDLRPGRTEDCTHAARGAIFNDLPTICWNLVLSYNCSQIICTNAEGIFLYDIKASRVTSKITTKSNVMILDPQLSPNQYGLWFIEWDLIAMNMTYFQNHIKETYCLVKLELGDEGFGDMTTEHVRDSLSWANLFSLHGHYIGESSVWVTDPRGSKLLWLPPDWRVCRWSDARWNDKFLALVASCHPEPMIIEFQL